MFTDTTHDFGNVARGSKAEFHFKFKNIYEEPAHVASVRSSCGCTSAKIVKPDLKTWDTGDIVATLNTAAFLGVHTATITVEFDKPFHAEVQLQVQGNIHSDVTMQPGLVQLDSINSGQAAEKKVSITHTGRSDWTISDVRSANTNFEVEVNETARSFSTVSYDLVVRLKPSAPIGYINDQLFLVTNDPTTPQIPVDVEGRVVADVEARPSPLALGNLTPGQAVQTRLVVVSHSKRPFKVVGLVCDDCITCKLPEEASDHQIIPITFTAGKEPGKVTKTIKIKTDLGENAVADVTCQATVVQAPDSAVGGAPQGGNAGGTAPASANGGASNSAGASPAGGASNNGGTASTSTDLGRLPTNGNFHSQ